MKILATIVFVLNLIISFVWCLKLFTGDTNNKRCTNVVTRSLTSSMHNVSSRFIVFKAGICTIISFVLGLLCKNVFVCLPSLLVIVLSLVMQRKAAKDEQRIKDSRYLTKTGLQVTGQAGEAVGNTIATIAPVGPGAKGAIRLAGKGISKLSTTCAENMTDTTGANIDISQAMQAMQESAQRLGLKTEGKSIEQLSNDVLSLAPASTIAALPDNMSVVEKACHVIGGLQT